MMWFLQRKIRRRLVKVVAIVVLSLALTLPLNAVTLSSWVGEEWPEIEAIGEGDQLPMTCNASSMTVSRLDKDKNEYFEAVQVCATITKFGTIGIEHNGATVTGKTYLQMGGPAYELGFNGRVLPVPNADYLVTRYRPGGGVAWSRATSFIENPATLEVDSRTNTYKASAATVSQTLNDPVTGQRIVSYPGAAVSSDGRWLLIERSTGLLRVDLENRDQMGSFGYGGSYGTGSNPVLHLAISNDGNHVFQSGSANYGQAYVTDLTTCTLDHNTPLVRNTNCVRKSLWQYLRSELGNISSIYYPYFNDDASTLAVSILISGEVFKDVMLFQPGYQHGLLDYLALGDSFSSGEGDRDGGTWYVEGTDGTAEFPNEKCHLSTRSYPLLIATKTSLSNELAKSVACSGATTEDVRGGHKDGKPYRGQFDQFEDKTEEDEDHVSAIQEALAGFLPGRAAQIEFVREYKPKVITLTIGGNDVGFAHKLKACIGLSTHLASQTCDYATERTGTGLEIWRQFENLKQLYLDLQNASPKTSIYVLGYPKFFGEEVCGLNVGLDAHERDYINRSVSYMNDVIEAAAKSAGVTYVDVSDSLAGYNLCSGTSDHAFNGITYGKDQGVAGLDFISNGSYHPNEKGHELMTTSILSQFPDINHRQKCEGNSIICFDSSVFPPPIPDYFITSDSDVMPYSKSYFDVVIDASKKTLEDGKVLLDFTVDQLKKATMIRAELHSDPVLLGEFEVGDDGTAHIVAEIPESVPFGYHTLNTYATTFEGEEVNYYQGFWYINSEDDMDGDGVLDTQQECVFGVICEEAAEEEPAEPQQSHLPVQASPVAHAAAPLNETAFNRAAHTNQLVPDEFVKGIRGLN